MRCSTPASFLTWTRARRLTRRSPGWWRPVPFDGWPAASTTNANITPERVVHLRKLLSPADRRRLLDDIKLAPAWMHPYFRAIAREEDTT